MGVHTDPPQAEAGLGAKADHGFPELPDFPIRGSPRVRLPGCRPSARGFAGTAMELPRSIPLVACLLLATLSQGAPPAPFVAEPFGGTFTDVVGTETLPDGRVLACQLDCR